MDFRTSDQNRRAKLGQMVATTLTSRDITRRASGVVTRVPILPPGDLHNVVSDLLVYFLPMNELQRLNYLRYACHKEEYI